MPLRHVALVGLLLVGLLAAPPSEAHAQEAPLQAANGGALYLGSLEGIFVIGAPIGLALALANGEGLAEAVLCMAVMPLCALFLPGLAHDAGVMVLAALAGAAAVLAVPPIITGVGVADRWDVDGSLVLTSAVHGFMGGGLFGAGLERTAGGGGELGGVLGGLAMSALAVSYGVLRLDALVRDPRLGVEANLLMWGPPSAMLVTALVLAIAGADLDVGMLVTGLVGLCTQALAIGLAEHALSEPLPMMMGP